jgi:cysteine desulfurase family protein (TIGR01976 family)
MDISFVRAQFPALANDFVFMDNAGGSQILGSIIDRMQDHLINRNVQLGASYTVSENAGERLRNTHEQIASYINANNPKELVFGHSSTMMLRILSLCISRQWKKGDEVIISNSDHEANVSCWTDLKRLGIDIKIWKVNRESFEFEIEDLKQLFSEKTRLVAMVHASNVLGRINPIRKIADVIHDAGALLCVDGVAFAPHRKVDVQALGIDFYVFSWYKVYGPHMAVLWGKLELLQELESINHYFIGKSEVPYKLQPGNFNYELTASLEGIADYFKKFAIHHKIDFEDNPSHGYSQCFSLISKYEEELAATLLHYLNDLPAVKIIGSKSHDRFVRVPTISFVHSHFKSSEIVEKMDRYKIGIRFGDFYAKKLIQDLNLEGKDGVVRISLVHYNSIMEVEKLIQALNQIL